jgi:hypothetical protein
MSEERGAKLFRALHDIIDAVTNLNLRDLEAEAKAASASDKGQAESSTQGASTSASASSKGKVKDPDPNWTEVPYNPVPITPLSTSRPRFSQVVGSSSESFIVPPSRISVEAVSLANHPVWSPAVVEAAMNLTAGGGQGLRNIPELQIWYRQSRAAQGVPRRAIFGPDSPGQHLSAP